MPKATDQELRNAKENGRFDASHGLKPHIPSRKAQWGFSTNEADHQKNKAYEEGWRQGRELRRNRRGK